MSNKTKKCRHCQSTIPEDAKVCFLCNKSQGSFLATIESAASFITIFSMILSIALVTLSWLQFREATRQRTSAESATRSAMDALSKAEQARDEARNTVELLRTNVKLSLEIDKLTPKLLIEEHDPARVEKVRRKLEEFAVPNEKEREKWLDSLK